MGERKKGRTALVSGLPVGACSASISTEKHFRLGSLSIGDRVIRPFLLEHLVGFGGQVGELYLYRFDVPDVVGILADGAVGGEFSHSGCIQNRHASPVI